MLSKPRPSVGGTLWGVETGMESVAAPFSWLKTFEAEAGQKDAQMKARVNKLGYAVGIV